ncbi:CMRF35-like molecule 5 [Melanotaenia boesemani]|uniref:CMRF35-like molecule 5 n=1 Tax=Melanotaenia boesemani TaxID=1250792 RepID=UPI001C0565C8|nr:CMRF35-like molecule 5 [Melanotaenia boesemani]
MKVRHTLTFFFLLTLQDGDTGDVYRRLEGGNITVKCSFTFSGSNMFFCRENCEGKNLLIETTDNSAQNGRYSMRFVKKYLSSNDVNVSITKLEKSDSGWYTCGLERVGPDSEKKFKLVVIEAPPASTPTWTPQPLSPSSASTTESLSSTSASSSSSSSSSETIKPTVTPAARPDGLLAVGLLLFIMILILSAALLLFCKKRSSSKPEEPAVESGFSKGAQANQVYEEIREDVVYTKPETTDVYSLASAPQNKVEDDSVDYSEVQFRSHGALLHSAPCGHADVIYLTPRGDTSSANTTDASSPLYATVTSHQQ